MIIVSFNKTNRNL